MTKPTQKYLLSPVIAAIQVRVHTAELREAAGDDYKSIAHLLEDAQTKAEDLARLIKECREELLK